MRKVVQIREFEAVTCEMYDSQRYGKCCFSVSDFTELKGFAKEYTYTEDHADALEFMNISYRRNVGDIISFKNYVGVIQLPSGLQIEILPKIDFGTDVDEKDRTKRIFLKMLQAMNDFDGKVFGQANLNADRMNLYEIFISMYLDEVRQLVKKGIRSGYISTSDNQNYYKGKLLANDHIRLNMVHRERFYVSFDEFHSNRPENRLIKSTLLKLCQQTASSENLKEIYRLLSYFEMVKSSINYECDFSKLVIDRNTKDYRLLMQWSRVFLLNQSFTTFAGQKDSKAILFPMEKLYESYVAKQIKRLMLPLGWNVSTQDRSFHLFEQPRKHFALRPDIVMYKDDRCVILDTKWKVLTDSIDRNYGISQGDMYQMYAYSKKYNTSEIWLLYPMTRGFRNHEPVWFNSGMYEHQQTNVNLFFIDLGDDNSIKELSRIISENHAECK